MIHAYVDGWIVTCDACGQPVEETRVRPVPGPHHHELCAPACCCCGGTLDYGSHDAWDLCPDGASITDWQRCSVCEARAVRERVELERPGLRDGDAGTPGASRGLSAANRIRRDHVPM